VKYSNRLKGSVTQALVRSLLSDAGISVVPLGVEEVVREISELDIKQYQSLNLPLSLRKLPDFFAVNLDRTQSWLIEVKFRKTWNAAVRDELGKTLGEQVRYWEPLYLILFWGETPSKIPSQPSSWVKAVRLGWHSNELWAETDFASYKWSQIEWRDLDRIQDVFPQLNSRDAWDTATLHLTIAVSKGLSGLT
jgi:hypothetical protein